MKKEEIHLGDIKRILFGQTWDKGFIDEKVDWTNVSICKECGKKMPENAGIKKAVKCTNCGSTHSTKAVLAKE